MKTKILGLAMAFVTAFALFSAVGASSVSAQTVGEAIGAANGGSSTISLPTTFGFSSINNALSTIISAVFLIAGLLAFLFILLGAFSYLTAGDDTAKTGKARTMITNAVIGLLLVALVYVVWLLVINLVPGMKEIFAASNSTVAPDCSLPGSDC